MFHKLHKILAGVDADYADLRYEKIQVTTIAFNGKELTGFGTNSADGFVLRVLKGGGFSTAVFTDQDKAARAVQDAVLDAELSGRHLAKPVRLAPVGAAKAVFSPKLVEDPRAVSMDEKLEIVRRYNAIPLSYDNIATTNVAYLETIRHKFFVSTEGSEIREDLVTTRIGGMIISKDGGLTQDVRVVSGGSDGFQHIRNQEENFERRTKTVLDLLKAQPVEGGTYDCILNPEMTGVFTHEAFGHFSEADIIEELPAMREKMKIGARLGSEILNIVDDATMPGQLGFYRYDDEGVEVRRTPLLEGGVVVGRLHSRRTAAEFAEPVSGHCVAEDYRFAPIVRMGTIFVEPGDCSFEELTGMLGDGLYIVDPKGGQTSGENFTFGAQYGYEVHNGKLARMLRDININGNLYHTLKNIKALGNKVVLSRKGGCGKGQLNMRSCNGGPHMLVKGLVVGGA